MYEQTKSTIGASETKQPTLEQSIGYFWEEVKQLEETFACLRSRIDKFKRPNNLLASGCVKTDVDKIETRSAMHIEIDKMTDFVRSFRYGVGEQAELIDV